MKGSSGNEEEDTFILTRRRRDTYIHELLQVSMRRGILTYT
jgi:hypothetical protein